MLRIIQWHLEGMEASPAKFPKVCWEGEQFVVFSPARWSTHWGIWPQTAAWCFCGRWCCLSWGLLFFYKLAPAVSSADQAIPRSSFWKISDNQKQPHRMFWQWGWWRQCRGDRVLVQYIADGCPSYLPPQLHFWSNHFRDGSYWDHWGVRICLSGFF